MTLPSTAAFNNALNSKFKCHIDKAGTPLDLTLVEAMSSSTSDAEHFENLSLIFESTESFLQQAYPLEHDTLGSMLLLLVPIGKKDTQFQYEALINREKSQ